jgi:hypothetical protein
MTLEGHMEPAMTESMQEPLSSAAAEVVGDAEFQIERVRDTLAEADRRLRQFVQAQPLTALLGAMVAGYVAARVFRRL